MHFFIGSTNPVKLAAATQAGISRWSDLKVTGYDVESGVDSQPRSDEETRRGAEQRAKAAWQAGVAQIGPTSESLGIGLEGGVTTVNGKLWSTVWVAVTDDGKDCFVANGARFEIPSVIADPIAAGGEMGPVVGKIIANPNVRQEQGMIGVVTASFVDRAGEYASIAKLAIGLWYGRDWQDNLQRPT